LTDEAEEAANGYQGTTDTVTANAVAQARGSDQSFVKPDNGAYASPQSCQTKPMLQRWWEARALSPAPF
jgi:hypothetical protein